MTVCVQTAKVHRIRLTESLVVFTSYPMLLRTRPYLVMYYSIDTSIGVYYTFVEDSEGHTSWNKYWPRQLALAPGFMSLECSYEWKVSREKKNVFIFIYSQNSKMFANSLKNIIRNFGFLDLIIKNKHSNLSELLLNRWNSMPLRNR